MLRSVLLILSICSVARPAFSDDPAAHDQSTLSSTLWAATAVEHDASILQAYHQAELALDRALRDRHWTAAVEQKSAAFGSRPPAVIMDIDETILDNSPFEALLLMKGGGYDDALWQAWVAEAKAKALPGSVEFARYANARGVTVFYVTNRDATQKSATRTNLTKAGFPLRDHLDTLYCRGERPDWGTDKTTRRAEIAAHYRILLLFGDDLGDFISAVNISPDGRRKLVEPYRDNWGHKWFVFPNAMYGSWENALYQAVADPDETEKRRLRDEVLRRLLETTTSK